MHHKNYNPAHSLKPSRSDVTEVAKDLLAALVRPGTAPMRTTGYTETVRQATSSERQATSSERQSPAGIEYRAGGAWANHTSKYKNTGSRPLSTQVRSALFQMLRKNDTEVGNAYTNSTPTRADLKALIRDLVDERAKKDDVRAEHYIPKNLTPSNFAVEKLITRIIRADLDNHIKNILFQERRCITRTHETECDPEWVHGTPNVESFSTLFENASVNGYIRIKRETPEGYVHVEEPIELNQDMQAVLNMHQRLNWLPVSYTSKFGFSGASQGRAAKKEGTITVKFVQYITSKKNQWKTPAQHKMPKESRRARAIERTDGDPGFRHGANRGDDAFNKKRHRARGPQLFATGPGGTHGKHYTRNMFLGTYKEASGGLYLGALASTFARALHAQKCGPGSACYDEIIGSMSCMVTYDASNDTITAQPRQTRGDPRAKEMLIRAFQRFAHMETTDLLKLLGFKYSADEITDEMVINPFACTVQFSLNKTGGTELANQRDIEMATVIEIGPIGNAVTDEEKQGAKLLAYAKKLRNRGIETGTYAYNSKLASKNKLCFLPHSDGSLIMEAVCRLAYGETLGDHGACLLPTVTGGDDDENGDGAPEGPRADPPEGPLAVPPETDPDFGW